jgi:hypothetical protein
VIAQLLATRPDAAAGAGLEMSAPCWGGEPRLAGLVGSDRRAESIAVDRV